MPVCVSDWEPMGEACGPNFLPQSAFPGLWPFHTAWGIRITNLICRIIDFWGTCDLPTRLPWCFRRQSICLQCGRPGFDPWVRKIPWRRKWQSIPAFLPGGSHGWRVLAGLQSRGLQRVRHDWATNTIRDWGSPFSEVFENFWLLLLLK